MHTFTNVHAHTNICVYITGTDFEEDRWYKRYDFYIDSG